MSVEAGKTDDDVGGIVLLYFEEFAVVDNGADDLVHVVCLVGVVRDDFVEGVLHAVDGVGAFHVGSLFHVVLRHVAEQFADEGKTFLFG